MALVELARWWRSLQRRDPAASSRLLPAHAASAKPRTQLVMLLRTNEARAFLQGRRKELTQRILSVRDVEEKCEMLALEGSISHLLGDLERAEASLRRAVELDTRGKAGTKSTKSDEEALASSQFFCQYTRAKRHLAAQVALQAMQDSLAKDSPARTLASGGEGIELVIERREAKNLSLREFYEQFALQRKPVIIKGLVDGGMFVGERWGLASLRARLGHLRFTPRKRVAESPDWAALEDAAETSVEAFVAPLLEQGGQPEPGYLFDWSVAAHAPAALCEELRVPKFFAADALQGLGAGAVFRDAWPSLFIGPAGSRSGLHIDAFASNFWMAMLEGRKRWRIYAPDTAHLLGPDWRVSLDAAFRAEARLAPPNNSAEPAPPRAPAGARAEGELEAYAARWTFELGPGDVLFVPSGAPHCVDNLDHTLAISANYIDTSNLHRALGELRVGGVEDPRQLQVHAGLLQLLQRSTLPWQDAHKEDTREGEWTRQWLDQRKGEEEPMFVPWDAFKRAEGLTWAKRQSEVGSEAGDELGQGQAKRARCEKDEDATREKTNV